jgi:sec-independent protein translocase protein TatC
LTLSAYERGFRFGQRFRNTVFLCILAWSIGAGATFWWHPDVFAFLLAPAEEMLSPFDGRPVFTAPQDMFGATLSLSMKGGQFAAFPVLVVGALTMLKPFVPRRFWLFVTTYSAISIAMFALGASFVFFVMMPVSLNFLLTFGAGIAQAVILLTSYMALLLSLLFWIGIVFELPVVMQLLAKFRLVPYSKAKNLRKWIVPTAFIFAALITPSLDGTLTFLVALPMLLLYEIGLIAGWLTHPDGDNYFADLPMVQRTYRITKSGSGWVARKVRQAIGLAMRSALWSKRKIIMCKVLWQWSRRD